MPANVESGTKGRGIDWRLVGWSIPLLLLALPYVTGAPWTLSDYVFMGVLFAIVGSLLELAVRASGSIFYRAGAGVAVAASFLLIWVNAAVGFLGDEDNVANLIFLGVIAVALLGAVIARFRAAGMARAMFAAAAAQLLAGVVGLAAGFASPGSQGLYEVTLGTGLFGGLWLVAAMLFRKASA